jgi:hypothetical protein
MERSQRDEIVTLEAQSQPYKFVVIYSHATGKEQMEAYGAGGIKYAVSISPFGLGFGGILLVTLSTGKVFFVVHGVSGNASGYGRSIVMLDFISFDDLGIRQAHAESFFLDSEALVEIRGNIGVICLDRDYVLAYDTLLPNVFEFRGGEFINVTSEYKLPWYNLLDRKVLTAHDLRDPHYDALRTYVPLSRPVLWE